MSHNSLVLVLAPKQKSRNKKPCLDLPFTVIKSDLIRGYSSCFPTNYLTVLPVLGRRTSCCVGEPRPPRPGTMGVAAIITTFYLAVAGAGAGPQS